MLTIVSNSIETARLKLELYDKQKLYTQMLKDDITGPAKEQVAEEIADILKRLYSQLNPRKQ